jgi:putative ABC transport system permease protein
VRFYRLLSKVFPRPFRRDFERELETTAADMLQAEGSRGRAHRLRLWSGLVADAVTSGLAQRRAERAGRGVTMRSLVRDGRQALRSLSARPGSAAIIVILLAITMGANASVFGVVNATLLRPLPFADPERLVLLWESYEPMHMATMPWSDPDYVSARPAAAFAGTAIFDSDRVVLTGRGEPASLRATRVEGHLFDLLGVTAARGRVFNATETAAGRDDVVILSHAVWMERFGGSADILGTSILLDNQPRVVIGVLGRDVSFPPPITFSGQMISPESDMYLPYKIDTAADARGSHSSFAIARLRPGVTIDAARNELAAIAADVARQFPDTNTGIRMTATPLHGQSVAAIRTVLLVLLAAVGGVLLVACASIANLILARAFSRGHEMALRAALGASRASLVRQLLFESALLGVAGTAMGLVAAHWISSGILAINPIELPDMFRSSLDWRVLGFTAAMTFAAVCVFGLLPALHGSRTDLVTVLRGTRTTQSPSERRTRAVLVVVQVSLAVVLLVTSALTIRSLRQLWHVPPGFHPDGLVAAHVSLPTSRYGDDAAQRTFLDRVLSRAAQIPGTTRVAAVTHLPFVLDRNSSDYSVVGEPARKTGDYLIADFNRVSAGYVEALRIPLVEGRTFDGTDTATSPLVVTISRSLAERHWPRGGAVGHQLLLGEGEGETPKTIVGVVGDVRSDGFDGRIEPMIYLPLPQVPSPAYWMVMTTARPADALASEVRAAVHDIDQALPVGSIRGLPEIMADTVRKPQFTAVVMTAFAATALLIAALGLYGVLAFDVAQRRRELGVRIALGATASAIRRLVFARGFRLVGLGLATGIALSVLASRSISRLLFEVPATDTLAFLVAGVTLVVTTWLAIWVPARRAAHADPIETLRGQ